MNKEALDSLEKLLLGSLYSCDVEQCNEDYDKVKDYINNLEQQLQEYKDKEDKIKNHVQTQQSIIKRQPSADRSIDDYILSRLNTILSIIDDEEVFFHKSQVISSITLQSGDKVSFDLVKFKGKYQARQVVYMVVA